MRHFIDKVSLMRGKGYQGMFTSCWQGHFHELVRRFFHTTVAKLLFLLSKHDLIYYDSDWFFVHTIDKSTTKKDRQN